jgi:D-arabinose 5-phosphate isomerase GutQ
MMLREEALIRRAQEVASREGQAVQELSDQFTVGLLPVIEALLNCPGHVLVTGAGTSRAVAERFAHLLACCGTPALFIHAADALHGGAGAIKAGDVVYIISKGGQSLEINQFAEIARQRGARIIAHTEKPASALGQMADQVFHIVAPAEVDPYGMIATGSSLVNSAACDALCILLLEQRGYSREAFGQTHPGGAVGKHLNDEKIAGT